MARCALGMTIVLALTGIAFAQSKATDNLDFPIGIYSAGNPTDENFAYVKSLGFDYVHKYGLGSKKEEFVKHYLDIAEKHGLKVMFDVAEPLYELDKGKISEEQAVRKFTALLKRWKNHKALGFWYIYDEPSRPGMPPERLMKFHKIVKKETPEIPDAIALCWGENWWDWTKCADIIMPDYYPVRKAEFPKSMLNHQAEFFGKVSNNCNYMIPIVQCFGFPRYPNPIELRYLMFSTLVQKARGIFFWSYVRSRYEPYLKQVKVKPNYLEKTLKPILADFKQFVKLIKPVHKVLLVPNLTHQFYSSQQIILGIWKRDKNAYIVMINNWPAARDISFPLTPHIDNAELIPIFSTRYIPNLKVKTGTLSLHVLPWETFIWKVK